MTTSIQLVADQQLIVERSDSVDRIFFRGPKGLVNLTIEVTEKGPVLRFEGPAVAIELAGELSIDAERVAIHGREGMDISSGGDAAIAIAGDLETSARVQTIRAELGNVNVKANDHVKLNGELILLNC